MNTLIFILLNVGAIVAGYLLFQKAPPAWFRNVMQRRFARLFGVSKPYQLSAVEREAINAMRPGAAYADLAEQHVAPEYRSARLTVVDKVSPELRKVTEAARAAMDGFSTPSQAEGAPLPSESFHAPEDAVLAMYPRQVATTLRRSAGQMTHRLDEAPAPIRFLATMLTEGAEYRLSKRDGVLYLTAMGEMTPLTRVEHKPVTPQIEDTTIPPDMGDFDPANDVQQHDVYKTGDADVPKELLNADGEVDVRMCRRCHLVEEELVGPCIAVNE